MQWRRLRYPHVVILMSLSHFIVHSLTVLLFSLLSVGCTSTVSPGDTVMQADSDLERGLYEEALEGYRSHRDERLAATDRPEWENPHFYTLLMGDVELRRNRPSIASDFYKEADLHGVSSGLVLDRYRSLAAWYMAHDELDKAMEILKAHRARDPLLFDAMLDKVAKELTEREERRRSSPASS